MSLEVYGSLLSQPVRSVVMFCDICKIPYVFKSINLKLGEQNSSEFLKINPFGTVPTIVHNDYSLWEAAAIVVYLSDVFEINSELYPKDIKKRGKINAYLHWHHENTRFYCRNLIFTAVSGPVIYGLPRASDEVLQDLCNKLEDFLEKFNAKLTTPYLCGNEFTVADLFAFNEIISLSVFDSNYSKYENIRNWVNNILEIPQVQQNLETMKAFIISVKQSNPP